MPRLYSPLRYPGGKNCIFHFMRQYMLDNHLTGMSYAEPFAGGAGLALHLLMEEYVDCIYINDLDRAVYSFWHAIVTRNSDFCQWLAEVNVDMDTRRWARSIYERQEDADEFELAKATFFLNRTNVSGVLNGGVIGGNNQQGKYKIDARFNRKDLLSRVHAISKFADRIRVSHEDAIDFIARLEDSDEEIFIYLDPPYVKKGGDLYMNFYREEDHVTLSELVHNLHQPWLMSYDDCELINGLYSDYRRVRYNITQSTSNRVGKEIIIVPEGKRVQKAMYEINDPVLI